MDVNSTFEKTGIKCKVLQEIIVETDDPNEGILMQKEIIMAKEMTIKEFQNKLNHCRIDQIDEECTT